MKSMTALIPFHNNELVTANIDGTVYVAMKPIVEAMGLNWKTQMRKLKSDSRWCHMTIPYETKGGMQEMLSLDAYQLPAYLYTINPNKLKPELRDTIITFQKETFKVINDYWNKGYSVNSNFYEGKNINKVISGYKSQIKQLQNKLAGQKLLPHKSLDEKLQLILQQTDEALRIQIPKDHDGMWAFFQNRANYFAKYLEHLKKGGTDWEKFALSEMEESKSELKKARDMQHKAEHERNLLKNKIDEYVLVSNEMLKLRYKD